MENAITKSINAKIDKKFIEAVKDINDLQSWATRTRRELRRNATPAEIAAAEDLANRRIRFYTQEPIFISEINKIIFADFIIPKGKILVEIDGEYHKTKEQTTEDMVRDGWLNYLGYTVVRFDNDEVGGERWDTYMQCFRKIPENARKAIRRLVKRERKERERATGNPNNINI